MNTFQLAPNDIHSAMPVLRDSQVDPHMDEDWARRRVFDDPLCVPELQIGLRDGDTGDGDIVGCCFARIRAGVGEIKLIGVRADRRRQGIATAMLDRVEGEMRSAGVAQVVVGSTGPNYFVPGVDLGATPAIAMLSQRGYDTDRVARVNMDVDLASASLDTAQQEAVLAAAGIQIRRAARKDLEASADFALAFFSEGWYHEVRDTGEFDPIPLFIALHADRVISFAAYDVTGRAMFGPTGTRPDYRRKGIGGVLLKRCLASMRDRGDTVSEIGWAGPLGFYARAVGARIGRSFWVFKKQFDG